MIWIFACILRSGSDATNDWAAASNHVKSTGYFAPQRTVRICTTGKHWSNLFVYKSIKIFVIKTVPQTVRIAARVWDHFPKDGNVPAFWMALGLGTVFDNRSMNRVLCPVAIARRILFLLAPLEMLAKKNNPTRGPEDLHLAGDRSAYRWVGN